MLCSCIFSTIAVYSSTYSTIHSFTLETCALTRRIDHGFSLLQIETHSIHLKKSRWTQESIALTSLSRMQTNNYGLDLQACDPQTHWASLRAERCLTTNITDEWDFDFIMVMSECPQISLSSEDDKVISSVSGGEFLLSTCGWRNSYWCIPCTGDCGPN